MCVCVVARFFEKKKFTPGLIWGPSTGKNLTGKVGVIQNICDMVSYENQKFWGIFFHTHMGAS